MTPRGHLLGGVAGALAVAGTAGLGVGAAHAQEQAQAQPPALRDFCADRPGKGLPPCVLDAGHLQIETGLLDAAFQHDSGLSSSDYAIGSTELRYGLTAAMEAELSCTPLIVDRQPGQSRRTGVGDLTFGVLTALTGPDAKGPAVSLQGFVTAPTASHGLGAGGWTGGARLPASAPLASGFTLGLTPELDLVRNAAGDGIHFAWAGAAGLSRAFGPATFGVELWGALNDDPSGRTGQASADLTAALMLGANAQLDAGTNIGLNRNTPDVEVYVGISRRF